MGEEQGNQGGGDANLILQRGIDLICSLISLSYSVRVFSGKWQMIRTKLGELNSGLEGARSCQATAENNHLSTLVQAILQTLGRCEELANRCINVSYSGRLLMRSDLDSVCANLDAHIRSISGIYAAGVLSSAFAVVVCRPGPGASREDLRFYVRDLATRMKIGDTEMRRQALVAINELVLDCEKCVGIVVESDEIVGMLANLLDSPQIEIVDESAKLISVICGFDSYKSLLISAGIIPPLIRILECESANGKEYAIESLVKLTENSENAWSVSAHGGVTALLQISCNSKDEKLRTKLIGSACEVLMNLVTVEEIKKFMLEEGAVQAFINLISAKDDPTQISSMRFLQAIAYGDESIQQTIVSNGGIHAIATVLDPTSSHSSCKVREAALRAVESLCFSSLKCFHLLVSIGFIHHLLHFVRNGEALIQELALKMACKLCVTLEAAKKAMGDAGFIPEFIKFLEAKSYEIREMAAETICSMVMVPGNKKRLVQDERNIGVILQLIGDSKETNGELKYLVTTLLAVSSCRNVRRKIASSGCLKSIEKLAESGVNDARKIVRKVSSNKLHSLVRRFLHFHG